MDKVLCFADIRDEFNVSFGYIRQDIRAICEGQATINYTVALLVGCACEMLAAARGDRKHPEKILAEILDPRWKPLAAALFKALRHGLAHGFDTKHLIVDGVSYQIHMQWHAPCALEVHRNPHAPGLIIGPRILAKLICQKIDELEELLKQNSKACAVWYAKAHRHDRDLRLNTQELLAWKKLP